MSQKQLEEFIEITQKRHAVALLLQYLICLPDHPNKECWCASVRRAYSVLDRRLELLTKYLWMGVAWKS